MEKKNYYDPKTRWNYEVMIDNVQDKYRILFVSGNNGFIQENHSDFMESVQEMLFDTADEAFNFVEEELQLKDME